MATVIKILNQSVSLEKSTEDLYDSSTIINTATVLHLLSSSYLQLMMFHFLSLCSPFSASKACNLLEWPFVHPSCLTNHAWSLLLLVACSSSFFLNFSDWYAEAWWKQTSSWHFSSGIISAVISFQLDCFFLEHATDDDLSKICHVLNKCTHT